MSGLRHIAASLALAISASLLGLGGVLYAQNPESQMSGTSFCRISVEEYDTTMDIPDSLYGRRIILESIITASPDVDVPLWQEMSANPVFEFQKSGNNVILYSCNSPSAASVSERPIAWVLPILSRSEVGDVVSIADLIDPFDEDVIDMTGLSVGNGAIYDAWYDFSKTINLGVKTFPSSIGIERELTYDLSLADKTTGVLSEGKNPFTCTILTSLSLLPKEQIPLKKADSRAGTRKVVIDEYPIMAASRKTEYVQRWNLSSGRKIEVVIDGRIPKEWQDAISSGILEWNKAFEAIGLHDVIQTSICDGSIPEDPLLSTVGIGEGFDTALGARVLADKTTGEILSFHINIPADALGGVRKLTAFTIAPEDKRFRGYDLDGEAVADILRSQVMSIFCHCLGLTRNSSPYSISSENIFNPLAQTPADSYRRSLGQYDYHIIKWLYGDFAGIDTSHLLEASDSGRELLYFGSQSPKTDPRGISEWAGQDPMSVFRHYRSTLQDAVAGCDFLSDPSIPEDFPSTWASWAIERATSLASSLSWLVGGFESNDPRSSLPRYIPVSKSTQREAVRQSLQMLYDLSWLDSQNKLLRYSGLNKDLSAYMRSEMFSRSKLSSRLEVLLMAERLGANDGYTPEEFLQDIQDVILKDIIKGELAAGSEDATEEYLLWLIGSSPVTKQNYQAAGHPEGLSATEPAGVSNSDRMDIQALCYDSLKKAESALLKGCSAARDQKTRSRIQYLAGIASKALVR